jgi:hypothetical protein
MGVKWCIRKSARLFVEQPIDQPPLPTQVPEAPARELTAADAVEIWLARWMKTPRKRICARYGCDPRRIYEVWEGTRLPASRALALERLRAEYPGLAASVDSSRHRRIPRGRHPGQLELFDPRPP